MEDWYINLFVIKRKKTMKVVLLEKLEPFL